MSDTLAPTPLPAMDEQADRLIELGVHTLARLQATELRAAARAATAQDSLLVIHPERTPPSALTPLLRYGDKKGFVVVDMADVDDFAPVVESAIPASPIYFLSDVDRGDDLANWTPDEALPAITGRQRTPLTILEGIFWLLQQPELLERNHCFMTIGSRLRRTTGKLDARTPAIWISNGTGRDGTTNRNAPKVGWCWAGNRHTWLGFASAAARRAAPS